jgi:rubrerythrin
MGADEVKTPKIVEVVRLVTRTLEQRTYRTVVFGIDPATEAVAEFQNAEQAHSWLGQHNYVGTGRMGEYVRLGGQEVRGAVDYVCRDCAAFYVNERRVPDTCPDCGSSNVQRGA